MHYTLCDMIADIAQNSVEANASFVKVELVEKEEKITVYGMDFDDAYIMLTDDLGKTPCDSKKSIVVAAYNDDDCFLWGKELKNFAALQDLCAKHPANSNELLQALEEYTIVEK